MYQAHGWWLPDQDTHFAEMLSKNIAKGGGPEYQAPIRQISMSLCANKGLALDIGANVGLWTRDLCQRFSKVIAFEPVADFRDCLQLNVPSANLEIKAMALGATNTMIDMIVTKHNTGHSHVDTTSFGQGTIPMHTLDSLDLPKIDYIKIDCEGFEKHILGGGKNTILTHRPVIVIEDKRHKDVGHDQTDSALPLLLNWGAKVLRTINNDHVVGW